MVLYFRNVDPHLPKIFALVWMPVLWRYGEENLRSWKNHLVHLWPTSFVQANYVQPPQQNFSRTPMSPYKGIPPPLGLIVVFISLLKLPVAFVSCCLCNSVTSRLNILLLPCWQKMKVVMLRYFNPVGAHKSGRIGEDPQVSKEWLLHIYQGVEGVSLRARHCSNWPAVRTIFTCLVWPSSRKFFFVF